jgi:K+-sensing histidine kinase KdpD
VAGPLLACALMAAVRDQVAQATTVLVLVLLVVAAAATADRAAGLVAALSCAAWFDFFLTEPYQTFAISDPADVQVTVLLVVIGAAVTELALWGRRQQRRAGVRAGYLTGIESAAGLIDLHGQDPVRVRTEVAAEIAAVLDVEACRYSSGPAHDTRNAVLNPDGTVVRNGHPLDVDRDGLPSDEETILPVRRDGAVVGFFVVTSAARVARPTHEQLMVAVLLAEQVARLTPDG